MLKLKRADYEGNWNGFTLKPGYFYGQDTETNCYIATSGWECGDNVAIYFLEDGKWKMHWISIFEEFQIENLPKIDFSDKVLLYDWLEKYRGITPEEFDENYSEIEVREIEREYDKYFYDNLPYFVVNYLENNEEFEDEE